MSFIVAGMLLTVTAGSPPPEIQARPDMRRAKANPTEVGENASENLGHGSEIYSPFLSDEDWTRYERDREHDAVQPGLVDWAAEQNQESTLLTVGEIASGLVGLAALGLFRNLPVGLGGLGLMTGLAVLDVLDLGSVEVRQPSTTVTAAYAAAPAPDPVALPPATPGLSIGFGLTF